jgi:hypothetical protein
LCGDGGRGEQRQKHCEADGGSAISDAMPTAIH